MFILQVLGSKHWTIEKERRCLPARTEKMGDEGRELRGELLSFTLEQGDLIYIPRGYVHAAECSDSPSLHITLGVTAQMYEDVLFAAIKALIQQDPALRCALPLGFMDGAHDAVIQRAAQSFRAAADRNFLVTIFDQYRDELVQNYHLDVSGLVEEFFDPRPLNLDDKAGAGQALCTGCIRRKILVRLNFGARSITFPGFFRDALEYALSIPAFQIRDLPGEIEDEERVVFIERLIQEGLVVRNDVPVFRECQFWPAVAPRKIETARRQVFPGLAAPMIKNREHNFFVFRQLPRAVAVASIDAVRAWSIAPPVLSRRKAGEECEGRISCSTVAQIQTSGDLDTEIECCVGSIHCQREKPGRRLTS